MIQELIGKTIVKIEGDDESRTFTFSEGQRWSMRHDQDCCESVSIREVVGNLDSLVGSPLLVAEEINDASNIPDSEYHDSFTWTYYKFATAKVECIIKWYGESNGYYSETPSFSLIED